MIKCLTQKIELNVIIPALRKEFISVLSAKNISDAEISRKLGITKAAVSQYKHKKRGRKVNFSGNIKKAIEKSAIAIAKGKNANAEISKIISSIKKSREICCICRECNC